MNKLSYEVAMGAAKIAFCWNSSEGSIEKFQNDMADILIDMPEEQIMNKARRIGNATDNNKRSNISTFGSAGRLVTML